MKGKTEMKGITCCRYTEEKTFYKLFAWGATHNAIDVNKFFLLLLSIRGLALKPMLIFPAT